MKQISKRISYLLRHNPEGLQMDKEGWLRTVELLTKLSISLEDLKHIVETNNKKRFAFNEDETKIRASQGHNKKLSLNIKYKEVQYPDKYYHGTVFLNKNSILKFGLKSQSRDHVHLSKDINTAVNVGTRHIKHGTTVLVLEIDGNQMKKDGLKIYESENGVILADEVPPKYIKVYK